MREIKFRGKTEKGVWEYGDLVRQRNGKHYIHFYDANDFECMYLIDPATVGEYTGLLDNNLSQVFESDLLKDQHNEIWSIKWNRHWGSLCLAKPSGKYTDGRIYCSPHNPIYSGLGSFEIVGNEHDNPELLRRRT